jgi:hypothetical protein
MAGGKVAAGEIKVSFAVFNEEKHFPLGLTQIQGLQWIASMPIPSLKAFQPARSFKDITLPILSMSLPD